MLSVAKLTLGQEAYYEQQVARGLDDYYAGRGESPGIWAGSGAAGLGLGGVVEDGDLGTLLRGVNPASEERLRAPVRERTITVRTLDVESGEWREEPKRLAPVSGYDLVFSCPKSVSLLHALTDDERVRREISEAHEASWQAALGYLEREACVVRRGKGGTVREHGEGFVAAAFRHRTSRAQDPHLHTHVIVANMARTADGEWRALDGEAILKTYRLAAGYLYEAQLRHELTRRLGLEWTEPVKGMGELVGVPEEAIRAFSTRRRSLLEHMEALGTEGFAAARVAALATREAKEQVDLPRLREEWKARAAEHGLGRRELDALVARASARRAIAVDAEQLAARLLGRDGLTAKQTTFTMPELVRAVAGSLAGRRDASSEVLAAGGRALALPRASSSSSAERRRAGRRGSRPASCSRSSGRRSSSRSPAATSRVPAAGPATARADADASGSELTGEQRHARPRGRRAAPTGSSASSASPARARRPRCARSPTRYRESERAGARGGAERPRRRRARRPRPASPSRTLHRLLLDAQREGGLPHGCVLVVDEAGMAETRVLAPLLELVEQAEGKADPGRRPGPAARRRRRRPLPRALRTARRDRAARATAASATRSNARRSPGCAHGDPEPYLAHAARRGRLHIDDDPTAAKQRLLEDWWQTAQHDLDRDGDARLPPRRRPRPQRGRARAHAPRRPARPGSRRRSASASSGSATASSAATTTRGSASATAPAPPSSTSTTTALTLRDRRRRTRHRRRSPTRASTSSTATRSPATPPKAPPSTAPTSSSPTRARCRSGATSPAPAPAPKPASTSPTETRSNARRRSANPTRPTPPERAARALATLRRRAARARPAQRPSRHDPRPDRPTTGATRAAARAHRRTPSKSAT